MGRWILPSDNVDEAIDTGLFHAALRVGMAKAYVQPILVPLARGTGGSDALMRRRAFASVDWTVRVAVPYAMLISGAEYDHPLPVVVDEKAARAAIGALVDMCRRFQYPFLGDAKQAALDAIIPKRVHEAPWAATSLADYIAKKTGTDLPWKAWTAMMVNLCVMNDTEVA